MSPAVLPIVAGAFIFSAAIAPPDPAARTRVTVTQRDLVPLCLDGAGVEADKRSWQLDQREHSLAFTMRNRPRTRAPEPDKVPGVALVRFIPERGHRYEVEIRTSSPTAYSTRVWEQGTWKPVVRDRTLDRIVSSEPEWIASRCQS